MSSRTYVILGVVLLLIVGAVVAAQYQRARKTAELLDDLDSDKSDLAVDTMQELVKRGQGVEDRLIEKLGSSRRKERMRAAVLLGEVGTPKCGPALVALLRDEWPPVRRAAIWALGTVGYGSAAPDLLGVVKDEEAQMDSRCLAVQSLALLCMGSLDQASRGLCVPAMTDILKRRPEVAPKKTEEETKAEDEAKKAEEEALKAKGYEPIPAEPAPTDAEVELRKEAVLLLGQTGAAEALAPLLASLDDRVEPSAVVRQHAAMALGDLAQVPADEASARAMGQALLGALEDEDATVRMFAARALARHPGFGEQRDNVLDTKINSTLGEMAQELTDEGEPGYWVREAARTACDARSVSYESTKAGNEGEKGAKDDEKTKGPLTGSATTGGN